MTHVEKFLSERRSYLPEWVIALCEAIIADKQPLTGDENEPEGE